MMFKSLIPLAVLTALAGCATAPQPHLVDAAAQGIPVNGSTCMSTGTRIQLKPDQCANVPGRSFSKDELDRTGAPTTAEALRMLDPSLWR
jgi:hypothetical protein